MPPAGLLTWRESREKDPQQSESAAPVEAPVGEQPQTGAPMFEPRPTDHSDRLLSKHPGRGAPDPTARAATERAPHQPRSSQHAFPDFSALDRPDRVGAPAMLQPPRLQGTPTTSLPRSRPRRRYALAIHTALLPAVALASLAISNQHVLGQATSREAGPERDIIWQLLPSRPAAERAAAFAAVQQRANPADLGPLADLLRLVRRQEEWFQLLDAAGPLLGENLREVRGVWGHVTAKIAAQPELPQHPDYVAWKTTLLADAIDPRFREFFPSGAAMRVRPEEIVWGGVGVDGIPALDHPTAVPVDEATFLEDREPVFGVSWNGESRAYPLRMLDWHEMVNDTVGGIPFAIAYCTLCGAGVAFDTRLNDREHGVGERTLKFGSSGLLMRSNKLMYDDATKSLWNQLTGEAVVGKLAAGPPAKLSTLPVVVTTWNSWRNSHPDTTVVSPDTGYDREYELGAPYGHYFGTPNMMFPAFAHPEAKLPAVDLGPKEQLFVVRIPGKSPKPFHRNSLEAAGITHSTIDSQEVVIIADDKPKDLPVPAAWRSTESDELPAQLSGLSAPQFIALATRRPATVGELSEEILLAMRPDVRLAIMGEYSPDRTNGAKIARRIRDRVAQFGLAAPFRAYAVDGQRFERRDAGQLIDTDGRGWTIRETQLTGPDNTALKRLPGHLVFRFGYEAFLNTPRER